MKPSRLLCEMAVPHLRDPHCFLGLLAKFCRISITLHDMNSTLFIITGTPHSGISALCQGFTLLGSRDLNTHAEINSQSIHKLILQDLGTKSDMIGPLPPDWLQSDIGKNAKMRLLNLLQNHPDGDNAAICHIADPFIGRFYPLWSDCLKNTDFASHVICMVRHPWETALSLSQNYDFNLQKSHLLWFVYLQYLLNISPDRNRTFITYDQLLSDPITTVSNIFKKINQFDFPSPTLVYNKYIDFFQSKLKHFHASSMPDPDRDRFQVYADLYSKFYKIQSDESHYDRASTFAPGIYQSLLPTLLQYIGHIEKQSGDPVKESPLTARIIFPKKNHSDGAIHSINLQPDQWQKITLQVSEPQLLSSYGITLVPLNTTGMVTISSLALINLTNNETVWRISNTLHNRDLNFVDNVINIPEKESIRLLINGLQPKIRISLSKIHSDMPLGFEMWIKPSVAQDLSKVCLLPMDLTGFNDFVIDTKDLPENISSEDRIAEYVSDHTNDLSNQERFDLFLQLSNDLRSNNDRLKAVHYLNTSKQYASGDSNSLFKLAIFYINLHQQDSALDCLVEALLGKALIDDKLSKQLINKYSQIREEAKKPKEHGHQLLIDFIARNIDHINNSEKRPLTLVEIGSTREAVEGQGSTKKLAEFCHLHGLHFITVDMDPQNTRNAEKTLKRINIEFKAHNSKGENFLQEYNGKIDFLFLDAYDFDHGKHSENRQRIYEKYLGSRISDKACHLMHLECVKFAKDKIPSHGAICIDDCWYENGQWQAKGTTAVPYLIENHFTVVASGNNGVVLVPDQSHPEQISDHNPSKESSFGPQHPLLICSHHKSGASYTVKTFKAIAEAFHKKLWMKFYDPDDHLSDWDMCIHQHGRVNDILKSVQEYKGWHCIRHPKALIYSAVLYHQKCREPWVDVPLEGFSSNTFWAASHGPLYNLIKSPDVPMTRKIEMMNSNYESEVDFDIPIYASGYDMKGKTYREFLSELRTTQDKVLFEMRSYSRGVINDMINFTSHKRFFTIKLEDIAFDPQMESLKNAFTHLGFQGEELNRCLDIASQNCLWNIKPKMIEKHATTGMSDEWKAVFSGTVNEEFHRLFGNADEDLGYVDTIYN